MMTEMSFLGNNPFNRNITNAGVAGILMSWISGSAQTEKDEA